MKIIKKIFLLIILISLHNCNGQDKKDMHNAANSPKQNSTNYTQQKLNNKNDDSLKFGFTDLAIHLKQDSNFDYDMSINNKTYQTNLVLESANVNVLSFKNTNNHVILVEGDDYYNSVFFVYTYVNNNLNYYGYVNYEVKDAENNKEEKKIRIELNDNILNIFISQQNNNNEFKLKKIKEVQQLKSQRSNSKTENYNILKKITSDINRYNKPDEIIVYSTKWAKDIKPTDFN